MSLKKKITDLEKNLMFLADKYNFSTKDHNLIYDKIAEILDDISLTEFIQTLPPNHIN